MLAPPDRSGITGEPHVNLAGEAEWQAPRSARGAIYIVATLVAIALLLSLVLRLDRIVTSVDGLVVSTEPNIVLQTFDDSIIRALNVREGDQVQAKQILATLDPTFTTADVNQLKVQWAVANAQVARLDAERGQSPMAVEPQSVNRDSYLGAQYALYQQRKAQFEAQLASFDQKISQTEATIVKVEVDTQQYAQRLAIFEEIEGMRAVLNAKEISSKLQLLQSRDQRIEIFRSLHFARNSLNEARHQQRALRADREAFIGQWLGAVEQDLVAAKQVRDTTAEQLSKAEKRRDLVTIAAPEAGIVLRRAKLSAGSIIKAGEVLLQLVPMRAPLEAEVRVAAQDIAFIRAGDPTIMKLDAFDYIEHGWVEGTVKWISEGAFTLDDDSRPVAPFYRVRIAVTALKLRNIPETTRLVPGMRLSADIHVGSRTVFAYMFHRMIRGYGEAMRER